MWLQVFGIWSITAIYSRYIVSAILKDKKGVGNFVHSTFHHFCNFSTMTDMWTEWCYTHMYVSNAISVSEDHIRRSHYIIKRDQRGCSCDKIVARQPGNRNLRHLKMEHVYGNGCMYLKFWWGGHQYLWARHFHLWVGASASSGRWEHIMKGGKPHIWGKFKHDTCSAFTLKATVLKCLWRTQRKTDLKQNVGDHVWLVLPIMGDSMKLQVLVCGT